jgi:O-antigen ligase
MPERLFRIILPLSFVFTSLFAVGLALYRPGYLNNYTYLGAAMFVEILIIALWKYEARFFPLLLIIFLWAGADLPLSGTWTSGRWLVLTVGAIVGFVIYLRRADHFFGGFDLLALTCVIAALVSTMASLYTPMALLKAGSLLLLFLYAVGGARTAVLGREECFLRGLLLGCEFLVYVSAICYFVLHVALYGNPNALGAIMGVVALPVLFWGVLVGQGTAIGRRRTVALLLCVLLLLSSYARASFVGAAGSASLVCFALRRYRLLIAGIAVTLVAALVVATVLSSPKDEYGKSESVMDAFIYKGHEDQGVFGSRRSPWGDAMRVVEEHPWFGVGFGTSVTSNDPVFATAKYSTTAATSKEHGNSYLAILESQGLLGIIPFLLLVAVTVFNITRVLIWTRRTGNPANPALPIAAVLTAGLLHAVFEDWLFAVGFYLCVFFWSFAFVLADMVRAHAPQAVPALSAQPSVRWNSQPAVPASAR